MTYSFEYPSQGGLEIQIRLLLGAVAALLVIQLPFVVNVSEAD